MHSEVFYLRMGLVFQKVADFRGAAMSHDGYDVATWRCVLLERIKSAEPPPEELVNYADHLVAELNLPNALDLDPFETQTALELMAQLPPTEIDRHIELLALFLQGKTAPHAIRVLAKASPQAIASGGDELKSKLEAIVASPTAPREDRKVAQVILKKRNRWWNEAHPTSSDEA